MMRKRLLSLLLGFALLLAMTPPALAAESGVRETHFFTEQPHTVLYYDDIVYVHIELQPILDRIKSVQALLPNKANAQKAAEGFAAVTDMLLELDTMATLAYIRHSRDVMDQEAAEELSYTESVYTEAMDAYSQLLREALRSPCSGIFKADMTEEDVSYYREYTAMTREQLDMLQKERELETEYERAAAGITVRYDGVEWTDDSAYSAYTAGTLDAGGYQDICGAYVEKQNEVLGPIYLELAQLRTRFAKSCGFDSYADYAYAEIYGRDYTPEDIRPFHQAVKDGGFYGISNELQILAFSNPDLELYYGDYANEETLAMVEGYMGRMSGELAKAYGYMHSHGFYDIEEAAYKDGSAYTVILSSYKAPFFFSTPTGFFADFMRIVHEFGHYNEYYWCYDSGRIKSIDLAEVHSQGLELLFTHWYDDIFGESARFAQDVLMMYLIENICSGALYDELQQYVYATDHVTLEQINRKYRQLCGEYGLVDADDPREELYDWVQISHNFTSPCYYISYAVSAVGAFNFWLDARKDDYFGAVDEYLRFAALPGDAGFQESFAALDMSNPLSPDYLSELSGTLRGALRLDERALVRMPQDLTGSEWFAEIVYELYLCGAIEADSDGCIYPYGKATWSDAAALSTHLRSGIPAGVDGGDEITRLEFVGLLAEAFRLGTSGNSSFSDTKDGAVASLADKGLVSGYADGTFRPDQPMSRAEMWVLFYHVLLYTAQPLWTDMAA